MATDSLAELPTKPTTPSRRIGESGFSLPNLLLNIFLVIWSVIVIYPMVWLI